MKLRPVLAELYRRLDDRTWEFILRTGVRFHDGREMTVDDVMFSFGDARLTASNAPGKAIMSQSVV